MGWHGHLDLHYRYDGQRTTALDRHEGPLRVLAGLHPEGPQICHHVLVHAPGGIVGGDTLDLQVRVDAGAHGLVTTPGATRFYRSAGDEARQSLTAQVAEGGRLEWLPLETIAYDGCRAVNRLQFELAPGGQMIGWDVLALGLPAAGKPYLHGRFEQHLEWPGVWLERGVIDTDEPGWERLLDSPLGWDGQTALATMWCASGNAWQRTELEALVDAAREDLGGDSPVPRAGVTSLDARLVVLRALAGRTEPLWALLQAVRRRWRRLLWNAGDVEPRVWRT
ncbi:urease accessory protein UreD [Caldimonas brevitalea]|uniref:Urease accessory protein UreD n=1 Tax=Caldimonas brevitalea TaxID=413882 RepID=A0A0G3BNU3_9BURK|nr:urease accessory protein UreD [Caldimonas brevitalea]AKJ31124.1 urease accessory protein ureD [Caldimonas brevitalea]